LGLGETSLRQDRQTLGSLNQKLGDLFLREIREVVVAYRERILGILVNFGVLGVLPHEFLVSLRVFGLVLVLFVVLRAPRIEFKKVLAVVLVEAQALNDCGQQK